MRTFYVLFILGAFAVLAGGSGCNIVNPAEPVPTFVRIDSFGFNDVNPRGSTSNNITNVWVFMDNQSIGNFDLPVTFPVIVKGTGVLTVIPGIDFDGLRGYPVTYTPYAQDTMKITPRPGETIDWTPLTSYLSGVTLPYNETFDQPVRLKFSKRSGDTTLERTVSDVYEGAASGLLQLEQSRAQDSVTILSDSMTLTPGRASYIELDYKGDMPLSVGMRAYRNDGTVVDTYIITLRERADWKKFYIGVREFVGENQGPKYQILLGTRRPAGQASGSVRIDNVKVVSF